MDIRTYLKLDGFTYTELFNYLATNKELKHYDTVSNKMKLVNEVRKSYTEVGSMRQVAKQNGISRNTLRKYLDANFSPVQPSSSSKKRKNMSSIEREKLMKLLFHKVDKIKGLTEAIVEKVYLRDSTVSINKKECITINLKKSPIENLDSEAFNKSFISWTNTIKNNSKDRIITIDGKTSRRSHDKEIDKKAIHIVNAWADENDLILGQLKTPEKSNEITAIPKLLYLLFIKVSIITIDAMGTQKIAEKIIENTISLRRKRKKQQEMTII